MSERAMNVTIGDQTFAVSAYHASFLAESLRRGAREWEETAVEESRRVIRQGGGFDFLHPRPPGATYVEGFQAAQEAREIRDTHNHIAIALYHASDSGNCHFLCDPATCQGQRDRLARIEARHAPVASDSDEIPL